MGYFSSKLLNYDNPRSLGSRMRKRRARHLLKLVEDIHAHKGSVNVLDIGGARNYWNILPAEVFQRYTMKITLLNLPGTLNPELSGEIFTYTEGDATDLTQYPDQSFDLVHSNSVIEHLLHWGNMKLFAREVRRLAPCYFVQTPNFWFPFEPHVFLPVFHWLPRGFRIWIARHFKLGPFPKASNIDEAIEVVDDARLLTVAEMRYLFDDAVLVRERFLLLTKSVISIKS